MRQRLRDEHPEGWYGKMQALRMGGQTVTTITEEPIAPVQDSDVLNSVLLASHNPREALHRIGYLVQDAREHIRNKDTTKAMVCLNKIAQLTGNY